MYKKMAVIGLLGVAMDQFLKFLVIHFIPYQEVVEVISNFFYITHVRNDGAAWSILAGNVWLFIVIAILALIAIYFLFIKDKNLNQYEKILCPLLMGGIVGNLIDRIIYGYVVDYLSFIIIDYAFPVFNFADIMIVCSTFGLLILSLWEEHLCKKLK